MAKNRLLGDYPVIGIRPTIDGRRGPLKEGQDYRACAAYGPMYKNIK